LALEHAAVAAWIVLLLAAWPYVQRVRHPATKMLAAYLVFVSTFSLVAGALFIGLTWLMGLTRIGRAADTPIGMVVFLALIFGVALLSARAYLERPPHQERLPS